MENLEDDLGETLHATTTQEVDNEQVIANIDGSASDNLNDSVEIIEHPIEVLDLTSPQPSTSTSNSAGAVGASSSVKRNLDEALKETNSADQNPSTSATNNTTTTSSASNLLECPICLQTCIHPARLPCGHIFCFLCVKGVAYKNRRCAMCRREIPPEFLDHPQLVNGIEDICTTKATDDGYQWFYEGRNGGWWAYEKRNACEIEEAFQNLFNKHSYHQLLLNELQRQIKQKKEENKNKNKTDNNDDDEDEDGNDFDSDSEGEANDNKKTILNPFAHDMQICGTVYTVDFENMVQYPQAMPYRKRKICRAKGLPSKGVAGLITSKKNRRMKPYQTNTNNNNNND